MGTVAMIRFRVSGFSWEEKAALFAEHLAEVFTPNDNINNQEITDFLDQAQVMDEPETVFTLKEIKKEISYLNNKKIAWS